MSKGFKENFEIKFINHACFQILGRDYSVLVDPWFTGKVFNDSWSLLRETAIGDLDLSKLRYIFISHEHPDHLNWNTLKQIRESSNNPIDIITPTRRNNNVKEALTKLGYTCYYTPEREINQIAPDFCFFFIKKERDSSIVFKIGEKVIFNMNDCEFTLSDLRDIKDWLDENHIKIDFLFNQFSLAGYYGDENQRQKLDQAMKSHIDSMMLAQKILNPKVTIPFASYITFCREQNSYLNDYIVDLVDLYNKDEEQKLLIPFYLENVSLNLDRKKSLQNALKWQNLFKEQKNKVDKVPTVSKEDISDSFNHFIREVDHLSSAFNGHIFEIALQRGSISENGEYILQIKDLDMFCKINFLDRNISFYTIGENEERPIAIVCSYDLNVFFKLPWGADTMNITSCFKVCDDRRWSEFILFRDSLYVK